MTKEKHIRLVEKQMKDPSTVLGRRYMMNTHSSPLGKPPINSSTETLLELNRLLERQALASKAERNYTVLMDDLDSHYKMWDAETEKITGKTYGLDFFWRIAECADGYVNHVKLQHDRPRPFQIAPYYGKTVRMIIDDPGTGSYPSGHSYDAWLFTMILTMKHPEHRQQFESIANRISDSRMIAGVHFLSDLNAGKELAIHALNTIVEYSLLKGIV
jgi:acid phosphatase (class A)